MDSSPQTESVHLQTDDSAIAYREGPENLLAIFFLFPYINTYFNRNVELVVLCIDGKSLAIGEPIVVYLTKVRRR